MAQDPGFDQVSRCFRTHTPSAQAQELMTLVLDRGRALATLVVEAVPPCRERSMALTELEAAVTHARAGLVREDYVNNGVSVQRHREQMPRATAIASVTMNETQAEALLGLHKLLARVLVAAIGGPDLWHTTVKLDENERKLLEGFLAITAADGAR